MLTGPFAVLYANAHPSMSHVSPAFAPVFGYCLRALRKVVYTEAAQPFIIAGSGTLGWCAPLLPQSASRLWRVKSTEN